MFHFLISRKKNIQPIRLLNWDSYMNFLFAKQVLSQLNYPSHLCIFSPKLLKLNMGAAYNVDIMESKLTCINVNVRINFCYK